VKKAWTKEESEAVSAKLGSYFYRPSVLPGKAEILKCLEHPALHARSWRNVKDYVRNIQQKHSEFNFVS